jgi:hypothetical protein
MSETQNEYKTDAEPTPGPWKIEDGHWDVEVTKGEYVIATAHVAVPNGALKENARLIAAAGTAAQEAKEMGYDPQKAVEAVPDLLAVFQDIDRMGERLQKDTIRMMVEDALASAEGSGDE